MRNQQNDIIALTVLSFFGGVLLTIACSNHYDAQMALKQAETYQINQGYEFVWNDDVESIPAEGYVKVDTIDGNIVYLSPDE
jgi:hypothetical protein